MRPARPARPLHRAACALALAAGVAGLSSGTAAAQGESAPKARAEQLQRLLDCRGTADTAARLACYDAAADSFAKAETAGDIVVVDRAQAQAARREAFGFRLPSLTMFDRGAKPEELDRVSGTLASAGRGGDGLWVVEMEGGAVWKQIIADPFFRGGKRGDKVEVRKAALGSFFMNVGRQSAIRVRRVE